MRIGSGDRKEDATHTTGYEEETLQGRELGRGYAEQSCRTVDDSSSSGLVFVESISGKKDESGSWSVYRVIYLENPGSFLLTSVYDTGSGGENACRGSIADGLVDAPELIGRRSGGDRARDMNQCLL
jgi:hypothetical protein